MYIKATGNISPQNTFGHQPFLEQLVTHTGNRLNCVEPDYKDKIDPKLIRRMSRIIKMGVAAGAECLQEAGVTMPDAIITGTAYGCLEDTGNFLTKMVEHNEDLLTPTAFIQSTHNTIGAQIALLLQCKNYNNAFVHRGFSFESALLDGMLLLKEKEAENVLVGAIDETTNISHAILTRLGLYKKDPISNLDLYTARTKGTVGGEGAAFFLLANEASGNDYAKLDGLATFYKPTDAVEIENKIAVFLAEQNVTMEDIDATIVGINGDTKNDAIYTALQKTVFNTAPLINYKHLCGEYPTSTAFALWMAANIVKNGTVPTTLHTTPINNVKKVLVYNNYQNIHHSLLLVSAC